LSSFASKSSAFGQLASQAQQQNEQQKPSLFGGGTATLNTSGGGGGGGSVFGGYPLKSLKNFFCKILDLVALQPQILELSLRLVKNRE